MQIFPNMTMLVAKMHIFLPIRPTAGVRKKCHNFIQCHTQLSASQGFYSLKQEQTSSKIMLSSSNEMFSCRFYQPLAFVDLGNNFCHIIGCARLLCQEMHYMSRKRLFEGRFLQKHQLWLLKDDFVFSTCWRRSLSQHLPHCHLRYRVLLLTGTIRKFSW